MGRQTPHTGKERRPAQKGACYMPEHILRDLCVLAHFNLTIILEDRCC